MSQPELEKLFFKPITSKFKAESEDENIVKSENYKLISHEKKFLGLRKRDYLKSKEIFLLKHKDAHDLAKLLFKTISKTEPQLPALFYCSEDLDWAAFLFTAGNNFDFSMRLDENSLLPEKVSLPSEIDFVIGVNNGYNIDDDVNFYLILRHKKLRSSFLTIENYKLSREEIENYLSNNSDIKILENIITQIIAPLFLNELQSFIGLHNSLAKLEIDKKYFVAVCLDLYNKNRSITSIKNDHNLRSRISNLISRSRKSVPGANGNMPCAAFVDFIIQFNYFDLDSIQYNREKVEELFIQKRAYQKVENIFPGFIKHQSTFDDYLKEQENTFMKINTVFQF